MAVNITTDHRQAFEEAYEISGALVSIGASDNIKAILPLDGQTTHQIDGDGATQFETESVITVLSEDLPAITRETIVSIAGVEYRITDKAPEGAVSTRLELINP